MPLGHIEFWNSAKNQGMIRADSGEHFTFTAADVVGIKPAALIKGTRVAFEPKTGDSATRVRDPNANKAEPPPAPMVFDKLPVPEALAKVLAKCDAIHPGLRLDKYLIPVANQEDQKVRLRRVAEDAKHSSAKDRFPAIKGRHRAMIEALGAETWSRKTSGPLTLHLARASMLENAGICLHPIHGFPYLPGTGLKGLAHSYAETVWKPAQTDAQAAQAKIDRVFGRIEEGETEDKTQREGADRSKKKDSARSGIVTFHDAWPEKWPKLDVDVVNNHHTSYYEQGEPPGDWDSPKLVYFLAIPAGQAFHFALSHRLADDAADDIKQAKTWLDDGLTHLGCGAKTAAGYGRFAPESSAIKSINVTGKWAGVVERVRLITPAFLAGADQGRDDCDLRSATLRGLLRWWWRTLHAGYVDVPTLRRLEAALWGNTEVGGAIQLAVARGQGWRVSPFDYKERFRPKPEFKREHWLEDPLDSKSTQGLFYAAYGMDDKRGQPPRFYVEPEASWTISIQARASRFKLKEDSNGEQNTKKTPPIPISPDQVLEQARSALWLLTTFGGVGSKGRKGFGSLEIIDFGGRPASLVDCQEIAAQLRGSLGFGDTWRAEQANSPALGKDFLSLEIATNWSDPWYTLDQLGFAYQGFAKQYAHDPEKLALGLPRQIHGPMARPMPHQHEHTPPQRLRAGKLDRHASPVHLHVGRGPSGLILRVLALPSDRLPNRPKSVAFLTECLEWLRTDLDERAQRDPRRPPPVQDPRRSPISVSPSPRDAALPTPPVPPPPAPKPIEKGQQDRVGILQRQGDQWTIRFEGDARTVTLINPDKLPPNLADRTAGLFYIAEANKAGIRARFDRLAKK